MDSKFRNYCTDLQIAIPVLNNEDNRIFYCAYTHFPRIYLDEAWARQSVTRRIEAVVATVEEAQRFGFIRRNIAGKYLVVPKASYKDSESYLDSLEISAVNKMYSADDVTTAGEHESMYDRRAADRRLQELIA